jgi:beta-lactamase class A
LVLRLLVMGIGLGVITGTALKLLAPHLASGALNAPRALPAAAAPLQPLPQGLPLGRFEPHLELTGLSQAWARLAAVHKDLKASGFVLVLDDGRFAQLRSNDPMPAASSIKTPVLLAAMEDVDHGLLRWNEPLTLTKEVVGAGSGWMGGSPLGTRYPVYEAAAEMIRVSDNTATNLLIKRLGGKASIDARFRSLGLTATKVNNWLPDLGGTNTTSSHDLARTIALVETGERLSPRARDLFREVMGRTVTRTLIPAGVLRGVTGSSTYPPDSELRAKGITVLNKTGDIGIAYADGALIELPNGQRAVAAFMVKGPFNDPRSTELIRSMAAEVSRVLIKEPAAAASTAAAAAPNPSQTGAPAPRPAKPSTRP